MIDFATRRIGLKEIEELKEKNKPTMKFEDNGELNDYSLNQVKVFEEAGCRLLELEKKYLQKYNLLDIGDLIGKRISDNKLLCFEIKASERDYFISGKEQFEQNYTARGWDINVLYVFINYKENRISIKDVSELWFNLHIGSNTNLGQIHQPINLISKNEAIERKKRYYENTFVKFEIVKCLKNRELSILSPSIEIKKHPIRYLLAFNLDYLEKHFKRFDFYKNLSNLYHSVALLKPIVPVFSYDLKKRKDDEAYKEFNKDYDKFVEGYNLFIDIDADWDWKKALKDTLEVKKIFDEYKLPYYVFKFFL